MPHSSTSESSSGARRLRGRSLHSAPPRLVVRTFREDLREVLEEWIVLGLKMGHLLPEIDGMTLNIQEGA